MAESITNKIKNERWNEMKKILTQILLLVLLAAAILGVFLV